MLFPLKANMKDYAKVFFGGLVWDAVITLEMLFVMSRNYFGVFLSTFALTYIVVLMYNKVMVENGLRWDMLTILAVASGLGATLTVLLFDLL